MGSWAVFWYPAIVAVIIAVICGDVTKAANEEPECTSRFDYDFKIVQKLFQLEQMIADLQDSMRKSSEEFEKSLKETGSVYIRWGKSDCSGNAKRIYKGFTAGKKYSDEGSGSDTICLPDDPSWFNYTNGDPGSRGHVYGTEIDINEPSGIFENQVNQQDIPCAACHVRKGTVLMIPGRSHCYPGWNPEYAGYLMAAYHGHPGPHNHVCVDHHPESLPRGGVNDDQHILYVAIAKCGSLPCPPYVENRELACVVCSI